MSATPKQGAGCKSSGPRPHLRSSEDVAPSGTVRGREDAGSAKRSPVLEEQGRCDWTLRAIPRITHQQQVRDLSNGIGCRKEVGKGINLAGLIGSPGETHESWLYPQNRVDPGQQLVLARSGNVRSRGSASVRVTQKLRRDSCLQWHEKPRMKGYGSTLVVTLLRGSAVVTTIAFGKQYHRDAMSEPLVYPTAKHFSTLKNAAKRRSLCVCTLNRANVRTFNLPSATTDRRAGFWVGSDYPDARRLPRICAAVSRDRCNGYGG